VALQLIEPGLMLLASAVNGLLRGHLDHHENLAQQAGAEFHAAYEQYLKEQNKLEHELHELALTQTLAKRRMIPRITETCAKIRPQELGLPDDVVAPLWRNVESSKAVVTGLVDEVAKIKIPQYDGSLMQAAAASHALHNGMARFGGTTGGNLTTAISGFQALLITVDTLFRWYQVGKSQERTEKIGEAVRALAVATPRVRAVRERIETVARVTSALAGEVFRSSFFAAEIIAAHGETRLSREACALLSERDRDQLHLFFVAAQALWEILDAPIIDREGRAAETRLPGAEW
jgi:hypothetical protein